jgi:transposase, IS5 family
VKLGLEDGSKRRVDTTVVETDIHHPTDNTLLWDVVRVGQFQHPFCQR